jgi:hypothetical protein
MIQNDRSKVNPTDHTARTESTHHLAGFVHNANKKIGALDGSYLVLGTMLSMNKVSHNAIQTNVELKMPKNTILRLK